MPAFAAQSGQLGAAEGGAQVAQEPGVEPDQPDLDPSGPIRPGDPATEAEQGGDRSWRPSMVVPRPERDDASAVPTEVVRPVGASGTARPASSPTFAPAVARWACS